MAYFCAMLYKMADKSSVRVRLIDALTVVLWVVAATLLVLAELAFEGSPAMARFGLFIGMLALGATFWAIAVWMVEVIRLEYEITTLRRVPKGQKRSGNGD